MNKLEEVIAHLCPNGVIFKCLEDCCEVLDRQRKPVSSSTRTAGDYPYYGANGIQDYVSGYIFNGKFVLVGEDGSVITKNGKPVVTWAEGRIWVNNHAHIISEKTGVLLRYLFYCLQTIDITGLVHGNIPKLTGRDFRALRVPVPPLEVQREIVRILDDFTELKAELTTKLTAELTARKKQYEHYLNDLLSFDGAIPKYMIGDLFDFKNGLSKGKEFFGRGNYIVKYTDVYKNRRITRSLLSGRVECDDKELQSLSVHRGDVFFTRTSETKEEVGIASVMLDEVEDCVFSGFLLRGRPKTDLLLPEYCAYCFATKEVRSFISSATPFTTRASLSGTILSQMKISVPSIERQWEIVKFLDSFESKVNSLVIDLPAEAEARQKQYEFYRDKLLSFGEAAR